MPTVPTVIPLLAIFPPGRSLAITVSGMHGPRAALSHKMVLGFCVVAAAESPAPVLWRSQGTVTHGLSTSHRGWKREITSRSLSPRGPRKGIATTMRVSPEWKCSAPVYDATGATGRQRKQHGRLTVSVIVVRQSTCDGRALCCRDTRAGSEMRLKSGMRHCQKL